MPSSITSFDEPEAVTGVSSIALGPLQPMRHVQSNPALLSRFRLFCFSLLMLEPLAWPETSQT